MFGTDIVLRVLQPHFKPTLAIIITLRSYHDSTLQAPLHLKFILIIIIIIRDLIHSPKPVLNTHIKKPEMEEER
ncbi:uncharacterized [Tachysurus ichikawai]